MSTADQLRAALAGLSLDTRGHKKVLAKRLAKANQPPKTPKPPPATRPEGEEFDSFLVCDVEGTCERIEGEFTRLAFAYPNEIIEFPCILLQWRKVPKHLTHPDRPPDGQPPPPSPPPQPERQDDDGSSDDSADTDDDEAGEFDWRLEVVAEFHSFVRPTWRPKLSGFCTELTGIEQSDVDRAPTYPELLSLFKATFAEKHALFTRDNRTVWVTDGPWDLRDFIAKATFISLTPRPSWLAGPIVDLKLLASTYFAKQNKAKVAEANGNGDGLLTSSPPLRPAPSPLAGPSTTPVRATPTRSDSTRTLSATAATFTIPASATKSLTSSPLASPPTSRPSTPLSAAAPAFPAPAPPGAAPVRPPPTLSIPALLDALALPPFAGRPHSGLDDSRNAARIVVELARRGWPVLANRMVPEGGRGGKERRWGWMRFGKGEVATGRVDWEGFVERERRRLGAQGAKRFV